MHTSNTTFFGDSRVSKVQGAGHEPMLFFHPPYASALDERLARGLVRHLEPHGALADRVAVETSSGAFVVDFVYEAGGRRIGFDVERDDVPVYRRQHVDRERLLVDDGGLDALFILRECDVRIHLDDLLFVMAMCDPALFSGWSRADLLKRASLTARRCDLACFDETIELSYGPRNHVYWTGDEYAEVPGEADSLVVHHLLPRGLERIARVDRDVVTHAYARHAASLARTG